MLLKRCRVAAEKSHEAPFPRCNADTLFGCVSLLCMFILCRLTRCGSRMVFPFPVAFFSTPLLMLPAKLPYQMIPVRVTGTWSAMQGGEAIGVVQDYRLLEDVGQGLITAPCSGFPLHCHMPAEQTISLHPSPAPALPFHMPCPGCSPANSPLSFSLLFRRGK